MTTYVNGTKKQELYIGQYINGQNPIIPGLIAHYTFDDISGATVADETGNYPGTLINGPPTVAGWLGNGTDFDPASDQYMDAGVAMGNALGNGVSALSVSLWFKMDTRSGKDGLFTIGDLLETLGEFTLSSDQGTSSLLFTMSDVGFSESTPFTDQTSWHHVICIYSGLAGILYLGNVKKIDVAHSTDLNLSGLITAVATQHNVTRGLDGKMDQVRVYNKELTVAEIGWLYNEKVGPWMYRNGIPI